MGSVSGTKTTSCNDKRKLQGKKAKFLGDNVLQYRMQLTGNFSHEKLITGLDLAAGFS